MADTIFLSSGSVTTILGHYNQFNGFAELVYTTNIQTTLNSKYNLNAAQAPTGIPQLRYFGIGINGYKNTDGNQGARVRTPRATNMDLYSPIPFRVVPVASDLSANERLRYRLRRVVTLNDVQYACYYLKTIVWDPTSVELIQKDTDDVETPYALDPANLTPTPPDPAVDGEIVTDTNRVIVRCTGLCEVTGAEVMEYANVFQEGDTSFARISELGFYTGSEVDVDASEAITSGTGVNKEAIYVQLAKHKCTLGVDLSDTASSMSSYVSFESSSNIYI